MDVNIQRVSGASFRSRNFKFFRSGISAFRSERMPIRCRGFTLIELMVTLSLSVTLLAVGVPAFRAILGTTTLSTQVNTLSASLALARSEAIKRGRQAVVCKSRDGEQCSLRGGWSYGWIVYVDDNGNRSKDPDELLIFVQKTLPPRISLEYRAFPTGNYIAYRPGGFSKMNGTFTFCVAGHPELGRAVIVNWAGRPRVSATLRDGSPLECD